MMTAVVLVILLMGLGWATGQLSVDYQSTCPQLESIIRDQMIRKQAAHPTTAAGTLRIFFHDCFVEGCDASVLIASTANNTAEKDADINMSLPGDGFDAVIRAKTAVEAQCPGVVSCADILSIVTRDLITLVGGPYYEVTKGRRDGLISQASRVKGNLPESNMTLDELNALFESKGFTDAEVVTLSGAHTVGFSHCKEFLNRLYNYSTAYPIDPTMNPQHAEGLRRACPQVILDPTVVAFNDVMSPRIFDNVYYQNLLEALGCWRLIRFFIRTYAPGGLCKLMLPTKRLSFKHSWQPWRSWVAWVSKLATRERSGGGVMLSMDNMPTGLFVIAFGDIDLQAYCLDMASERPGRCDIPDDEWKSELCVGLSRLYFPVISFLITTSCISPICQFRKLHSKFIRLRPLLIIKNVIHNLL